MKNWPKSPYPPDSAHCVRGMALKELEDGVKTGIFRRLPLGTNVQFMSPAHWIPKGVDPKTGKNLGLQLVIDARQLNKVLIRTPFPYISANYGADQRHTK